MVGVDWRQGRCNVGWACGVEALGVVVAGTVAALKQGMGTAVVLEHGVGELRYGCGQRGRGSVAWWHTGVGRRCCAAAARAQAQRGERWRRRQ